MREEIMMKYDVKKPSAIGKLRRNEAGSRPASSGDLSPEALKEVVG
jgi:hypothetical protein